MCGEQSAAKFPTTIILGSPPRVRGTVFRQLFGNLIKRITPACAGNSRLAAKGGKAEWDHPRVCGEQQPPQDCLLYGRGSPPRVRGTGGWICSAYLLWRITPACAGNRLFAIAKGWRITDHPRVCGEQLPSNHSCMDSRGSPPRVRGTGLNRGILQIVNRITPACAGNRNTPRRNSSTQ